MKSRFFPQLKMLQHPINFILSVFLFSLSFCFPFSLHAQENPQNQVRELYEKSVDAYQRKDYDASIEGFEKLIAMLPQFAPAYHGLGLAIRDRDGDAEGAIQYFLLAVKYDTKFALAYENLGRSYYSLGRIDEAQKYFEKTLELDPASANALLTLGWIQMLAKANPHKAAQYFKRALDASPNNPNILYALGMAYFSKNERAKAMEIVTQLRLLREESLAQQLEKSMRETKSVRVDPVVSAPTTPNQPTTHAQDGVKVRLSGKLDEVK